MIQGFATEHTEIIEKNLRALCALAQSVAKSYLLWSVQIPLDKNQIPSKIAPLVERSQNA